MADHLELPSGLVVPYRDVRARSLTNGPLDSPVRSDIAPNTNDPVGSVGPNVSVEGDPSAQLGAEAGFGSTHVMYPAAWGGAVPWDGWPVEWDVPSTWNKGAQAWDGGADIAYAAIDLNSRVVADMPWFITDELGVRQPPKTWLNNPQPEVYNTWSEFVRQVWWSVQACGEAFVVKTAVYADGYPRRFMMLDPWYVSVDQVDGVRRYSIVGQDVPPGDLLHLRYLSWPSDPHGHGPLEVAGLKLLAIKLLDRYSTDLVRSGGIPWAVLRYKGRLKQSQVDEIRAQWVEASRTRMGVPAILDQEADLRELQVSPKDMALAEQLARLESRIAVLLGVPPFLLSLSMPNTGGSSLTYSNASELFRHHWRTTLRPGSRAIARALNQWLLPAGNDLEVDPTAYVQNDLVSRAQYYDTMLRNQVMTVAEVRAAEGIYPVPPPPIIPNPPIPNTEPVERPVGAPNR